MCLEIGRVDSDRLFIGVFGYENFHNLRNYPFVTPQRWLRTLRPIAKEGHMMKEVIQDEETIEPFA